MQTKTQKEAKALKKGFKSQSAMEYLMTYGWAILIIAVVLSVLFYLGVFSGSSFLPQGCIAQSGFLCKAPILTTGGVLQLQIGEETLQTMNNTNVYFVPQGGTMSNASSASIGKLNSAQITNVSIQLSTGSLYPSSYKLGTSLAGMIYVSYTYQGMTLTDEIGTVTVKSVNPSSIMLSSPPATIPSGISKYASVTISNGQTSSTPAPFQQMVQFSEANYANYMTYNGNSANFEFFTSTGSIIPAWIESNSSGTITAWLNLPNGISASNSIQVYLGFASKTTNLLSNTGTSGIGEAPQLSSTYAQYDDGASVFPVYYNFAGTTLDSRISTISGVTLTQNNGLTIAASTTATTFYILTTSQTTSPAILEADDTYYGVGTGTNTNEQYGLVMDSSTSTSQNVGGGLTGTNYMVRIANSAGISPQINNGGTTLASGTLNYISQYTAIDSFIQTPTGLSATFDGTTTSASTTALTSGYLGFYLYSETTSNLATVQWLRVRAYPPNGAMPSVNFGGVS